MRIALNGEAGTTSPWKGEVDAKRRVGVKQASRFSRTVAKTARARRLRRAMTDAEAKLWSHLRGGQMRGLSFRRQHPKGDYVLDFYCAEVRLAVEVDGGQHGLPATAAHDRGRTNWLVQNRITVLRFWNHDVLTNVAGVIEEIDRTVAGLVPATPTRPAAPTDLPLSGGGRTGEVDR